MAKRAKKPTDDQAPGSDNSPADPSEYKVGPGCPPLEHRWPKGCRSPNPWGRPANRRIYTMLHVTDPLAAQVLDHGNVKIPLRKGGNRDISRVDANLDALFKQSLTGSTKAALAYHELQQKAASVRKKDIQDAMRGALEHQLQWMDEFIDAEAAGGPLPDVYPDPRDIIISPIFGVYIIGPITRADKLQDDRFLNNREVVIEDYLFIERRQLSEGEKREKRAKLKKMYKIFNEALSMKHQMSFRECLEENRKILFPTTNAIPIK